MPGENDVEHRFRVGGEHQLFREPGDARCSKDVADWCNRPGVSLGSTIESGAECVNKSETGCLGIYCSSENVFGGLIQTAVGVDWHRGAPAEKRSGCAA